jgi:hypothetical protein
MWTPCMLREDIVDGDVAHQGLRELDPGELLGRLQSYELALALS